MKVSYSWLSEYVEHGRLPADLADLLTMAGLEVDEIITFGHRLEGVVIGHVLKVLEHPKADKLTLCMVDIGQGEPVQIVCGAPNVAPGQKVPVATVGTVLYLPDREHPEKRVPVKIRRARIRGEISEGMICAEDELGLSEDHSGIMVLEAQAPVGEPFEEYLKRQGIELEDYVFDIALTPNRPDAACHIGIARDVAALTNRPLRLPEVSIPPVGEEVDREVHVSIQDPEGCGRYVALLLRNVKVQESPLWLQRRLQAIGLRPRNVVVDVTNYVMYEWGQPLHAFDFDRIEEHSIIVRRATRPLTFVTLDDRERKVPEGTLLICDAQKPIALAGIMGGANSEVTEATTQVLIESAWFAPSVIRRAAKALNLHTDASYRFERGVDPLNTARAAARAAQLICRLTGATLVPGRVDVTVRDFQPTRIVLRPQRVEELLGVSLSEEQITNILRALGMDVKETPDGLLCTVPTFRPDIEREVDLIEEIARIYGYQSIPEPTSTRIPYLVPEEEPEVPVRKRVIPVLLGQGFHEVYTNSLLREEEALRFNRPEITGVIDAEIVRTLNPISQEMAALRPSLLPDVLGVFLHNQNRGQEALRFFEFGRVFLKDRFVEVPVAGYREWTSFLVALSGPAQPRSWDQKEREADFFDLKGLWENLAETLFLTDSLRYEPVQEESPVIDLRLDVYAGDCRIGIMGQLHPDLQETYELKHPVYFLEMNWDYLVEHSLPRLSTCYTPISPFPQVTRDIAIVVDAGVPTAALIETIRKAGGPLLRSVEVFDLYTGEPIPPGKKSLAFSLTFGTHRTLVEEEIQSILERILQQLKEEHGAQLR